MIHADERKVKQVLLNLLSKASKINARGRPLDVGACARGNATGRFRTRKEVCEVRFSCARLQRVRQQSFVGTLQATCLLRSVGSPRATEHRQHLPSRAASVTLPLSTHCCDWAGRDKADARRYSCGHTAGGGGGNAYDT